LPTADRPRSWIRKLNGDFRINLLEIFFDSSFYFSKSLEEIIPTS